MIVLTVVTAPRPVRVGLRLSKGLRSSSRVFPVPHSICGPESALLEKARLDPSENSAFYSQPLDWSAQSFCDTLGGHLKALDQLWTKTPGFSITDSALSNSRAT